MGEIGSLGNIVFSVSAKKIKTISSFRWSGAARYAEHQRAGKNALTEFTGLSAEKISIDIRLSADLGVKVTSEIYKLLTYERNGTVLKLMLGRKRYGKYRWVIQSHTIKGEYYDSAGNLDCAVVSLTLLEYVKK